MSKYLHCKSKMSHITQTSHFTRPHEERKKIKRKLKKQSDPKIFFKNDHSKVTLNYTTGNGLVSSIQMGEDLPRALFVTSSPNLDALGRIIHSPIKI